MSRYGKYLFKRKNSQYWWIRFQYPPALYAKLSPKKVEFSLRTMDRAEAEILALPHIEEHKLLLFGIKGLIRGKHLPVERRPKYQLGKLTPLDEGGFAYAKNDQVIIFDKDMVEIRTEPASHTVKPGFITTLTEFEPVRHLLRKQPTEDEKIIQAWIKHKKISKHIQAEVFSVLEMFRSVCPGKNLKTATRSDAKKLIDHLESLGLKGATIQKKISHLRAAINRAIVDESMEKNVFSNIVPVYKDSLKRLPLSEREMDLVRRNLNKLKLEDQLLWKLLASTGMRLEEPFQITEEHDDSGIRYVTVGTKTPQSERSIPLPTSIEHELPQPISGPIFTSSHVAAGKRLGRLLRKLHIAYDPKKGTGDPRKVLHSLRHRAKDRLRSSRCPLDIQYEILGHEVETVAAGYGRGYPLKDLKDWIDKIGY